MFKRGFTLPNIIALILGLCVAIYFAQADRNTQEMDSKAASDQSGD
jgi:hypothetical protein